jgi:DNA-binding NarL/FixJ family response regulator
METDPSIGARTPRDGPAPRVAIIDADRRVRQSVADLLAIAGVPVVGSAGDIGEALSLVRAEHPEVLLVDPRLPDVDSGEALIEGVAAHWPTVRVVLMGWSDRLERPSLLALASGYLAKTSSPEEFLARTLEACACRAARLA